MARSDKVAAVAELTDRFSNSGGVVLTEYRGLSVKALCSCAVRSVMMRATPFRRTR